MGDLGEQLEKRLAYLEERSLARMREVRSNGGRVWIEKANREVWEDFMQRPMDYRAWYTEQYAKAGMKWTPEVKSACAELTLRLKHGGERSHD